MQKQETALKEEGEAERILLLSIRDFSLPNFMLRPRGLVSDEIPGRINTRIGKLSFFLMTFLSILFVSMHESHYAVSREKYYDE